MKDIVDIANEVYEEALDEAIQNARKPIKTFEVRGVCHYCDEKLEDATAVFCDHHCHDDYLFVMNANLRNDPRH